MHKILIVSATSGSNLRLAKRLEKSLDIEKEIVNLEDFIMPLYTPKVGKVNDEKINDLCSKFSQSNGLIFCAPEYNGGSPPILTNTITWLSVISNNWRDAFLNKKALIATHSGGAGVRFLSTFRIQLEHLGVIVYPRTIMVNKGNEFNERSVKNILNGFRQLL